MNKRVYNVLRKIAAEPEETLGANRWGYHGDRVAAAVADQDLRAKNKLPSIPNSVYPAFYEYANYPSLDKYEELRPRVAGRLARDLMKLTPGTDKFHQAVKYFMQRGDTTMFNKKNPLTPRPNPAVPEILKDREQEAESLGNLIGSNNYGKKYSDIG